MKEKIECPICKNKSYYELDDIEPSESLFRSKNPLIKNYLSYMLTCNSCGEQMEYRKYVE